MEQLEESLHGFEPDEWPEQPPSKTIIVPRARIVWAFHGLMVFLKSVLSDFIDFFGKYRRQRIQHRKSMRAAMEMGESIARAIQQNHERVSQRRTEPTWSTDAPIGSAPATNAASVSNVQRAKKMEDAGYRLSSHVAAVGHALARRTGQPVVSSENSAASASDMSEYRDYLNAQIILFEHYSSLSFEVMRDFLIVAGRYLYGIQQERPDDLHDIHLNKFKNVILYLVPKYQRLKETLVPGKVDNQMINADIAIQMYQDLEVVNASSPAPTKPSVNSAGTKNERPVKLPPKGVDLTPENISAIEAACDVKLTPENIKAIESAVESAVETSTAPELQKDRPPAASVALHPVTRLAETYPDLSKRWTELGDDALLRDYRCAWPKFLVRLDGLDSLTDDDPEQQNRDAVDHWRSVMDAEFPHFREVTRYFCGQLLIAVAGDRAPVFPPLLLLGDPGIGKTTYLRRVAADMGLAFAMQSMSGVSGGFVLTGSDSSWKAAKPGFIARVFLGASATNPMILLDEVDKASSSTGVHQNVQEVLLALLEPETSTRFVDEYLIYLQMDLSQVSFVATANDVSAITSPLLSRFHVMEVPAPSRAQRRDIAQTLYRQEVERLRLATVLDISIPPTVLDVLVATTDGDGSLRDLRGVLRQGLGNAMIRRSRSVDASLPVSLCLEDITTARPSRSVGFLP